MRARLLCTLVLVVSLCLPAASASADELTAQKRADIEALLRQSGADKMALALGATMARQISNTVKAAKPEIPARALEVMERELVQMLTETMEGPNGLIFRMVPVYAEAFTHDEIRQIVGFYQSPVGRKAVNVMPQLMAQGQRIGQDIGRELAPQMQERLLRALRREGFEPKDKGADVLDQMPGQGGAEK